MKKIITLTLTLVLAVVSMTAQTSNTTTNTKKSKANVTGYVKDSEDASALVRATIQILTTDTTKMITGGVTNTLGGYTIKNVEEGSYIIKVSYIGYHNFYRSVTIKNGETIHNVGTVLLTPNSVVLDAAVVQGQLPQMEVKEDTIIFNADAFKVPEGSVLEDLIKKLPGAEVSSDGTIKINGKTISKILVDGKEFFSSDKSVAMKNLPAEIVDKVKTYDKASDSERLTGIADGNEETVIDLTIKKGMKQGWFGNISLGVGTKDQYANRVMVNRFKDNFQSSIIGNLNTNGGGGMGSGRGGTGKNLNGNVGINLNTSKDEKYEIGGNVRYNGRHNENTSRSASENYVSTRKSFSDRLNDNTSHNDNADAEFKIEIKLDTATTLLMRPQVGIGNSASHSSGASASYYIDPYSFNEITNPLRQWSTLESLMSDSIVNHNLTGSRSFSDSKSASSSLMLNRRFYNKKGRNFSVNGNFNYSQSDGRNFNFSDVTYYQRETVPNDLIYRYRTSPNINKSFSLGFTYSEPFVKNLILQLSYNYSYSYRKSDSNTFNLGLNPDVQAAKEKLAEMLGFLPDSYFDYLSDSLSNYTRDVNQNHNINLSVRWNTNFITSSVGVQIQPQNQHLQMTYMGKDIDTTRNFFRISPTLNFRYRFNRQNQLNFSYRGNMSQPSITDLITITDDSNPLNIRSGNPDLKPSFSNNFRFGWNNYLTATMQTIFVNASFSNTLNSISNQTKYNDETGASETKPMNINGNWDISGDFGFNTPLFSMERFMLNTSTSTSYRNNVSYLYRNNESLKNKTNNLRIGERLSLTYRAEYWDVRLNGNFSYNHQDNRYIDVTSPNTYDFSYGVESNGNFDNGFGYATNLSISSRRGYASSEANTNELIWNAQVSYRFLKGKAATISLQAYDLLNQRSNFSRAISANSRTDTWTESVNSYFMVNFMYRFNLFGSKEARQQLRRDRQERETYRANMERDRSDDGGMRMGGREGGGRGGNMGGGNMGGGGRF